MPQPPVTLNLTAPIIYNESGTPTPYFQTQLLRMAVAAPIVGSINPNGNVDAPVYSLYIDEANPFAPKQYRKMLAEVGGDKKKGWVLL